MKPPTDWASSYAGQGRASRRRSTRAHRRRPQLPGEDLTLIVYTAAADSPPQEKLDFLTDWAGQTPPAESTETPTRHESETWAPELRRQASLTPSATAHVPRRTHRQQSRLNARGTSNSSHG